MKNKQMSYTLFVEKYRPYHVKDIILPKTVKNFFLKLVEEKEKIGRASCRERV